MFAEVAHQLIPILRSVRYLKGISASISTGDIFLVIYNNVEKLFALGITMQSLQAYFMDDFMLQL